MEKEIQKDIKNEDPNEIRPACKTFTKYIDGFPVPGMLPENCFHSALKYKPRPDDIFVATYPKCGTTWTQYILLLLFRQGEPIKSMPEFMFGSPYLELMSKDLSEKIPRPAAIKTHLPYHLAPRSDVAKYIYVTRNPKDCCVSYFHHMKNTPGHGFDGTFDDFFECFITGTIDYGDYFDNLLGWYKHRNDANVLFLTYEEMKENLKESILKIATFIDDKIYAEPLRNDQQKLETILKNSSFESMKQTFNQEIDSILNMSKDDILKSDFPPEVKEMFAKMAEKHTASENSQSINFVRKGIIGDWQNYFSEEQSRRLDEKFKERTKGTDIDNLWRKYM